MLEICKSTEKDHIDIINIIRELDLSYPSQPLDDFFIIKENSQIMGIANLEDFDDFLFLSSVGVKTQVQNRGIAAHLINKLLKTAKKDVYLYTTIPDFFSKFGFKTSKPIPGLPQKKMFSCKKCTPKSCVTMVKPYARV